MDTAYQMLKDLKCATCIHLKICGQNLGGLDLTMAAADCKNYDNITGFYPPLKFWRIFDVPGFYDIIEYEITESHYQKGQLTLVEGTNGKSWCCAGKEEFNKLVFFSEADAKVGLKKLMEVPH